MYYAKSSISVSSTLFAIKTNGVQITKAKNKLNSETRAAKMLPPVARYAKTPGGITHGTATNVGGIKPIFVKPKAIAAVIGGIINQGITYSGFNTIGRPNVIGSLMLNNPIGAPSFAIVLESSRFEKSRIAIIKPSVIPEPPI